MKKALLIIDKHGSAIDRLSQSVVKYNPHLDIQVVAFHPKSPDHQQIIEAQKAFNECDVLHIAYWRSGIKLLDYVDHEKFTLKKKVLCHYNPYDVRCDRKRYESMGLDMNFVRFTEAGLVDWFSFADIVVVGNSSMHTDLPGSRLINYGVDLDFFNFGSDYDYEKPPLVNMVVGRIDSKKGVLEVAKACKSLGYDFELVGKISDGAYFSEIRTANPRMKFLENVDDGELKNSYHRATIHVCNSQNGYESGTLPILESMACGVPVVTRNVGHVPDLYDGQNVFVNSSDYDDIEGLKSALKEVHENPILRKQMREKAWETVKGWSLEKYGLAFEKVYYDVVRDEDIPFVSIIIPTRNKPEVLVQSLVKAIAQDYPYTEIVISDSSDVKLDVQRLTKIIRDKFKGKISLPPIKYVHFNAGEGEYTLPKARNLGVIESSGDLLVFCDDRIGMDKDAVTQFVNKWTPGTWLWGIKDDAHKGFVENFSCIARIDLIEKGMFNERIFCYGGATQDIRMRFENFSNPLMFRNVPKAKARQVAGTKKKDVRRKDIVKAKMIIYKLYGRI